MNPQSDTTAPASVGRRVRKQPHSLHTCGDATELVRALAGYGVELPALVSEFVTPTCARGVLVTGSIAWRVANRVSDVDVLVLLDSRDALKPHRVRAVHGNTVRYLPGATSISERLSLFLSGIEIDLWFVFNPAATGSSASSTSATAAKDALLLADDFVTRLGTGWVIDGDAIVEQWRRFYRTDTLRVQWIADEFFGAAKNLEDLDADVGLATGHVTRLGGYSAGCLMRALMAFEGRYCPYLKFMLTIDQLIDRCDPETRAALVAGRELAFAPLPADLAEERSYVSRVFEYYRQVHRLLSRDEAIAEVLTSIVHDFDIIS